MNMGKEKEYQTTIRMSRENADRLHRIRRALEAERGKDLSAEGIIVEWMDRYEKKK